MRIQLTLLAIQALLFPLLAHGQPKATVSIEPVRFVAPMNEKEHKELCGLILCGGEDVISELAVGEDTTVPIVGGEKNYPDFARAELQRYFGTHLVRDGKLSIVEAKSQIASAILGKHADSPKADYTVRSFVTDYSSAKSLSESGFKLIFGLFSDERLWREGYVQVDFSVTNERTGRYVDTFSIVAPFSTSLQNRTVFPVASTKTLSSSSYVGAIAWSLRVASDRIQSSILEKKSSQKTTAFYLEPPMFGKKTVVSLSNRIQEYDYGAMVSAKERYTPRDFLHAQFLSAFNSTESFSLIDKKFVKIGKNGELQVPMQPTEKGLYIVRCVLTEFNPGAVQESFGVSPSWLSGAGLIAGIPWFAATQALASAVGLPTEFNSQRSKSIVSLDVSITDSKTGELLHSFPVSASFEEIKQSSASIGGSSSVYETRSTPSLAINTALKTAASEIDRRF